MSTLIGEMEIRLRADIARLQRDMDDARRVVGDATASMTQAANRAKAAFAGMAAGFGMSEVIRMSDQYAKFTAQLRLATDSQLQYNQAYADVKRIASSSQADLAATGTLYARIANGTKELGISQQRVASIVEATNLSLKVSGATTEESASAILQLSQAFGAGALRGEEFNAVNEAAPRLMKAIADGMGVPVGALKNMASEGKITSQVLAEVLPGSLTKLREEGAKVQTIAGAFAVLKSNAMEFVGIQSEASGTVAALTGGIGLLANNFELLAGSIATVTAAKVSSWAAALVTDTYRSIVAAKELQTATLARAVTATEGAAAVAAAKLVEARADVAATVAASNLANARVAELRAAVLAADGATALAITTNGLIPAQARALALEEARTAALAAQAVAANGATAAAVASTAALDAQAVAATLSARAMAALRTAMGFLGGPIGAIVTVLGIGAMAWQHWGDKAKEANDKAATSMEETAPQMLDRLKQEIEKLKERNALLNAKPELKAADEKDQSGIAALKADLENIKAYKGEYATQSAELHDLRVRIVTRQLAEATASAQEKQALKTANAAAGDESLISIRERLTGVNKQYLKDLDALGAAREKGIIGDEEYKKLVSELATETWKSSEAGKAAEKQLKANAGAAKSAAESYSDLMDKINGKADGQDPDFQKNVAILYKGYQDGKQSLSEYVATMEAYIGQQKSSIQINKDRARAEEEITDFNKRYSEGLEATSKVLEKMVTDAQAEADKNEEAAKTYGLSKTEIEKLTLARLEDQLAQRAGLGLTLGEIETLEKMIEAKKRSVSALGRMDDMEAAKKASEELDKFLDPTKAQSFGEALRNAFGTAGQSITKLTGALHNYGVKQTEIEAKRAQARTEYEKGGKSEEKYLSRMSELSQQSTKEQLAGYGDMAAGAAGFFKEHSKGYRSLMAVSQVFHAAELAMELESLATKLFATTTATVAKTTAAEVENIAVASTVPVTLAAEGAKSTAYGVTALAAALAAPFPANIPAFAVVAAMLAAIGVAVSGGSGGGGAGVNPNSAAERQKVQGSGTVLGDPAAKSASIAHSLEILQKNSELELDYQNSMLDALQGIATALGGAAKGVSQTAGITGGSAFGTVASSNSSLIGASHTKDITDSGVQFAGTFGQLRAGTGMGRQYEDVYTTSDGGAFRSGWSRTDTNYKALSAEAMKPFSLIFDNMGDLLVDAGAKLGRDSASLTSAINAVSVDFGVSLRGLTGQDLTDALNAGISVAFDKVTAGLFPDIQQFQRMGEGLGETLVRVATDVQAVDSVFGSMGKSTKYLSTNVENGWLGIIKTVYTGIGEMTIEAKERLVELSGGLEKFATSAKSFMQNFYSEDEQRAATKAKLNPVLAQYGLTTEGPNAQKMFRDFIIGLNVTTAAGAQTYATLMGLEQAFYDVTEAAASQRKDLQEQLDQLTMTSAELLAKQRDALDESNRALFDQVQAAQKAKDAQDAAKSSLGDFISRMKSFAETTASLNNSLVLGDLTTLTPEQQYAEARRQFEQTRQAAGAGDATAQGNLQSIEQTFLQLSKKLYAGDAQYASDLATVMRANGELSKWAAGSVDVAQASLDALNNSSASLTDISGTLKLIAQGVQYLPAALAGQEMPTFTAAAMPIDYSRMGTLDMAPLAAEVKALREEVKGLRADAQKQSDAEMAANAAATQQAAETVAEAMHDAATDKAWAAANSERKPS